MKIIRDNPGCVATIDNDCWWIHAKGADDDAEPLASSDDDIKRLGAGGYGSGHRYGGDILQALAVIVGIKVESV
ncbi:hypothetical protein [Methylibium sp. Pch-M]|uniref:hypothetical protein n=1 Tax=Methylibium sp. Pch-M TaxID=2082386 RepID=UPI0010120522|nr:hypothetical protein [Methylibium sp. Pch-M]